MNDLDRTAVPVVAGQRPDGQGWRIMTTLHGTSERVPICAVGDAPRLFQILRTQRLAEDFDNGYGVMVDFDLVRPLAEVMPIPATTDE